MDVCEELKGVGRRLSAMRAAGNGQVRLTVDLDGPHVRCCSVLREDGRRRPIEDMPTGITQTLRGVRDAMVGAGGEAWHRCVYILEHDGTFHFGIEYD